jgi:cobalt-zinc-cadmium efflux system outer membrane protein
MKRRPLWAFIVLAAVVGAHGSQSAAAGQAPSAAPGQHEALTQYEGPALTLRAALDEALAKNPELAALRAQLGVTRERPAQERSLAPPMLETTIWQWPINTLNPANTNMYMFMVTQDLPGRGKRELRAAVAEKDVALAQNDIDARTRHVFNDVKQAYAELFVSRKAIEIHLANADVLRQFADISQAKYTTGRISQQDVLKAVVEVSRLHEDIITLDQQAQIASAKLNTLLDRPTDTPVGPLAEPYEQTLLPALVDLQRQALEWQPEIQGARLVVERAEAALAVAQRDHKPDFSVQGGYMLLPQQTDGILARLSLTWPDAPWSRGRIDARVRELSADVEAARARQKSMENALRYAVQAAYVRVNAAEQRAVLLKTTILPQSQQTLEVSRVAYQADRVDFLALLDNERTLLNAQLDYYRALSDFDQALADLERAIGTEISPDMLRSVASENR